MLLFSIRRALWSAPRSPVEPTPWPWPFPAIYGREMSFCPLSGKPYDTLEEVIGIRPSMGSLKEYGVSYSQVDLKQDGSFDFEKIREAIKPHTRLIAIQRSKGYQTRPTLSVEKIGEAIAFVKGIRTDLIVMVDNCYGEFVERIEPSDVGADMTVGSLIKNPGGGLAPVGGYIAGTEHCIENAAYRLTSPGLGKEVGATLGVNQSFFQGLFLAPTVTASALKGAILAANVYESLGFPSGSQRHREPSRYHSGRYLRKGRRASSSSARAFRRLLPWTAM